MSDELTIRRQAKCASRPQGHTFTQETYGVCSNCLLKVDPEINPPSPEKECGYCGNPLSMSTKDARCGFKGVHKEKN